MKLRSFKLRPDTRVLPNGNFTTSLLGEASQALLAAMYALRTASLSLAATADAALEAARDEIA